MKSPRMPVASPAMEDLIARSQKVQEGEKLFVLSTAQHGIEGYVGAAVLRLFLEELLPRLEPETTGLLLPRLVDPAERHEQAGLLRAARRAGGTSSARPGANLSVSQPL